MLSERLRQLTDSEIRNLLPQIADVIEQAGKIKRARTMLCDVERYEEGERLMESSERKLRAAYDRLCAAMEGRDGQ